MMTGPAYEDEREFERELAESQGAATLAAPQVVDDEFDFDLVNPEDPKANHVQFRGGVVAGTEALAQVRTHECRSPILGLEFGFKRLVQ